MRSPVGKLEARDDLAVRETESPFTILTNHASILGQVCGKNMTTIPLRFLQRDFCMDVALNTRGCGTVIYILNFRRRSEIFVFTVKLD
jgi:hypothetical protein